MADAPVPEFDQFERAAAQVAQHAVSLGEAEQQAIGGKPRLLLTGEDADRHVGHALAQGGDEGLAILSVAYRGRGQHLQRVCGHRACNGVVALHDGQRLLDRFGVELPARLQAAPQTQHRLFVEDGDRVAAATFEYHEPHGVGPEVHDAGAIGDARCHLDGAMFLVGQSGGSAGVRHGHQSWAILSWRLRLPAATRGGRLSALPRPEREGFVMKYSCAETGLAPARVRT